MTYRIVKTTIQRPVFIVQRGRKTTGPFRIDITHHLTVVWVYYVITIFVIPQYISRLNRLPSRLSCIFGSFIRPIQVGNFIHKIPGMVSHIIPVTQDTYLFISNDITQAFSFLNTAYPNQWVGFWIPYLLTPLTVVRIPIKRQLLHHILHKRSISGDIPWPVLLCQQIHLGFQFKATVTDSTQIRLERRESRIFRQIHISQQIGSRTVIIVHNHVNPIIEKAQIKTQFKRMTLFPTQFTINHSGIQITQITIISTHRTVFTIYIKVTNTIYIPVQPIADTRFNQGYYFRKLWIFKESFLMHIPTGGYTRKESPTIVR